MSVKSLFSVLNYLESYELHSLQTCCIQGRVEHLSIVWSSANTQHNLFNYERLWCHDKLPYTFTQYSYWWKPSEKLCATQPEISFYFKQTCLRKQKQMQTKLTNPRLMNNQNAEFQMVDVQQSKITFCRTQQYYNHVSWVLKKTCKTKVEFICTQYWQILKQTGRFKLIFSC